MYATRQVPLLPFRSWYPVDVKQGVPHKIAFGVQLYFIAITMIASNMYDLMFFNYVVVACEQFAYLVYAAKCIVDLDIEMQSNARGNGESSKQSIVDILNQANENSIGPMPEINIQGIYRSMKRASQQVNNLIDGVGDAPADRQKNALIKSGIKHWIGRHKDIHE